MSKKAIQGRAVSIQADAEGNAPSRIHLMSAGHWHAPWHGNFEMTRDDLAEMVANFEAGVALVEGSKKLPINYGHDLSGKAAGWITGLSVENDGTELWGDVEWTPNGKKMLAEGEFRYISPEWNPRSFPYQDPEDEDLWLNNVFTGAGLTNIPLFKKLKPVMASLVTGSSDKPKQGEQMLKLEEVRAKKPEDLTDEEKAFLAEHKAELTDEERTTFGLEEEAPEETPEETPETPDEETPETPEEQPEGGKQASSGAHGLTADQIKQLQADAKAGREAQQELLKTRLTASVKEHVSRGAIKSDQQDEAVAILMASSESQRERISNFMASLPDNELVTGGEKGKGVQASTEGDAELTEQEKELAADFGNTPEEIAEYKKSKESK